jgi:hypothetical protein
MGEQEQQSLPSIGELIEAKLGFRLPTIALPQTLKNIDKAVSRLVLAGSDNLAARIERNTAAVEARSRADVGAIDGASQIAQKALGSLEGRAQQFVIADAILKQENRESILKGAIEYIEQHPSQQMADAAEISDDWLNTFSSISENKSSAEIRSLFSKILAGELRSPGSFSLKSLSLLAAIDQNDAKLIHKMFGYVLFNSIILKGISDVQFDDYLKLENLGVINGVDFFGMSYPINCNDQEQWFPYGGEIFFFKSKSPVLQIIRSCVLSRFGRELFLNFENYQWSDAYKSQFISVLRPLCDYVERAPLLEQLSDSVFTYGPRRPAD